MKTIFFIFIFIFLFSFLNSTIINIPVDQPTIQAGIDASIDADTVLVQPNTYYENINYNGKLITVGSLFLITQDTTYISLTTIDGNSSGSVVTFENSEDSSAVLNGFTITDGLGSDFPDYSGGGITCKYLSNPSLKNVTISGNTSSFFGGGVYCENSSPSLKNVTISDNTTSAAGGGIYCENSSPNLQNVTISGNLASDGGGIYCHGSSPNLQNVTITSNTAPYVGGGIYCQYSSPSLQNVTISDNTVYSAAGGIYCDESSLTLINSILWNNSLEEIFFDSGSVTATYSDIEGSWAGDGNIDSDPLFVNPGNGDYHLQSISPCIDAGDPASPLDPDGTFADMGAYFYHQLIPPDADFSADTIEGYSPLTINFTDLSTSGSVAITEWLWDFGDSNNSPLQNPANEYLLPGIYTVSLTVTDENDSTNTEIKTNYITVEYVPPAPPSDVQVDIVYPDAVISWTAVDTTISGTPITPDGYVVYYNEFQDDRYYFLAFTTNTSHTHYNVAQFADQMFYRVVAYVDLNEDERSYLIGLNDIRKKVSENEISKKMVMMK